MASCLRNHSALKIGQHHSTDVFGKRGSHPILADVNPILADVNPILADVNRIRPNDVHGFAFAPSGNNVSVCTGIATIANRIAVVARVSNNLMICD